MRMRIPKQRLAAFRVFLARQRYIKFAYLFGSFAKGAPGPLSDVDIAFYLRDMPKSELYRKELFLIGKACEIMGTNHIDVVILNDAPLLLVFNVTREGILLKGDPNQKALYEARIMDEYFDRLHFDEVYFREFEKRLAKRGLS